MVEAFVVVVVGGLGSLLGAYVAAVLIGVTQALGILFVPKITLVLVFLVMGVVLAVRPYGLFGRFARARRRSAADGRPYCVRLRRSRACGSARGLASSR